MWRSATCSEGTGPLRAGAGSPPTTWLPTAPLRAQPRLRPRTLIRHATAGLLAATALVVPGAAPAQAQGVVTQEEALRLAFPPPLVVERRTAYLDDAQAARAEALAGAGPEVRQRVVTHYVALRDGRPVGVAYFDSHRVRTLGEVLMFALDGEGRIRRTEVLKFLEPPEYRAPDGWLEQLEGKGLTPDLSVRRGIVNMTGATLTAEAVTRAARRVLALHAVIDPFGSGR